MKIQKARNHGGPASTVASVTAGTGRSSRESAAGTTKNFVAGGICNVQNVHIDSFVNKFIGKFD